MQDARTERPNRIPWPPLVFGAAALLALGLDRLVPVALPEVLRWPGAGLAAAGLGLDLWAMATMMRHRANILPHRGATALVTRGPFAWSRNPIYLGNTLLLAGAGMAFGIAWLVAAAGPAAAAVVPLAIRREEAHLAARFGPAWDAYAAVTPRWLGWRPRGRHRA